MMSYTLRAMTVTDIPYLQAWKSGISPVNLFDTPFADSDYPTLLEDNPELLSAFLMQFAEEGERYDRRVVIDDSDPSTPIGVLYISNMDKVNQHCQISIWIGTPNMQGKGIGSQVLITMLNYLFNALNLNKVYTRVAQYNTQVINFYQKNRFIVEGVERAACRYNNFYLDITQLSMLQDEFMGLLMQIAQSEAA